MRWLVLVPVLALTACAAPTPAATTPASSATPAVTPAAFELPAACDDLLPLAHLDESLVLLGGPGGRYGDDYLAEPTPEQEAGGITCIWGLDDTEESSVTISVAPVVAARHDTIVASLVDQGLNELPSDDGVAYAIVGDEDGTPAILNVVQDDSWISVIESVGGQRHYDEAAELAAEVHDAVYAG